MDPLEPILTILDAAIPRQWLKTQFQQMGFGAGCSGFLVGCIVVLVWASCIGICWFMIWIFGLWDKWP